MSDEHSQFVNPEPPRRQRGISVVINASLARDAILRVGEELHAGSHEAARRLEVDWYLVLTSPMCLVHRETGEMVELPEVPRGLCSRCGERHA
jgi:hypothetical protein